MFKKDEDLVFAFDFNLSFKNKYYEFLFIEMMRKWDLIVNRISGLVTIKFYVFNFLGEMMK